MSRTSPTELSVAFRSFERRLREAQGEVPLDATAGAHGDARRLLDEAGRLLNTPGDPTAIAAAIDSMPADQWDRAVLDRLRQVALDLGGLLRHIARATGAE
ncbi:MAG: hypothetical protein ACOYMR_14280 [Ilumatobacteraceae bacterium]